MIRILFILLFLLNVSLIQAQLRWQNVDSLYQPLPAGIHVFKAIDSIEGKPNIAFYVEADLKNKNLVFTTDTSLNRRLTPIEFYKKNDQPLLVVNSTFFSFETNKNLNTVIKNGKIVAHNQAVAGRGKDTFMYHHTFNSVLGISKRREADIAWVYTDSTIKIALAVQSPLKSIKYNQRVLSKSAVEKYITDSVYNVSGNKLKKWKMSTAIGGGPVLLQNGSVKITNNEERKFAGNAINDRHPRTAMGYTANGKLIILVVQGRFPGEAEGATLTQLATIVQNLGCIEALNLDGGGSSCLLINGKETIIPSDKAKQRAVPAVFIIQDRK